MNLKAQKIIGKSLVVSLLVTAAMLSAGSSSYLRQRARKKALTRSPVMQNPARTGVANPRATSGRLGTVVALVSYAPNGGSCFRIKSSWSRTQLQSMRFILRAMELADQKLADTPTVSAAEVDVLRSRSRLVPYNTTVRDTVRDSRGRIVATRSRSVQRIRREHNTVARVCFPAGKVLSKRSRFLELVGRVGRQKLWATWRLQ